jgi:hypothetical protein
MDSKANPKANPEALEAIERLLASEGWDALKERIRVAIGQRTEDCLRDDGIELYRAQGYIDALRTVLLMPEAIKHENRP